MRDSAELHDSIAVKMEDFDDSVSAFKLVSGAAEIGSEIVVEGRPRRVKYHPTSHAPVPLNPVPCSD